MKNKIPAILLLLCSSLLAQNSKETFGKNKVQYSDDQYDWWMYETNNFVSYWYGKSKSIAKFCIEIAESENNQVQRLFEYHLKDKIELVIYADHSDASQSNISLNDFQFEKNWDQEPKIKGQKIILYFNGDHSKLRSQLREGIIKIYLNSMFDGTAFQDAVQKVIALKLPDWFEYGLTEYLKSGWTLKSQNQFYEKWKHQNFNKFSNKEFKLAGLSFWNYLANRYGQQTIPNWLYMTRIQKDIYEACQLVFSQDFSKMQEEWYTYYKGLEQNNLKQNEENTSTILLPLKKDEEINSFYKSSDNINLILCTNQLGVNRIRQINKLTGKSKTLFKYGYKSKLNPPDKNYPIYCSSISNGNDKIIFEKRNRVYIKIQTDKTPGKKQNYIKLPEDIQRVYQASQKNNDELYLLAYINGETKLVLFSIKSKQYSILTKESWDKTGLALKTIQTKKCLLLSNHPFRDTLINENNTVDLLNPFHLFEIGIDDKNKVTQVRPLLDSNTIINNWTYSNNQIIVNIKEEYNDNWYLIDSFKNKLLILESQDAEWITLNHKPNTFSVIYKEKEKYYYSEKALTLVSHTADTTKEYYHIDSTIANNASIDTLYNYFQSPFGNPANIKELYNEFKTKTSIQAQTNLRPHPNANYSLPSVLPYKPELAIAYRNRFKIEDLSVTLNNELLFAGLNSYTGRSSDYDSPELGILFKTQLLDILENHNLEGGLRIPTTFNGLEAYVLYENRLPKMDRSYAFYVKTKTDQSSSSSSPTNKLQTNTWLLFHQIKYPFDHYRSLRCNMTLRSDHQFYLSTNRGSLEDSTENYQQRLGVRFEYVFDNALDISINLKTQTQFKFFFEASKRFSLNTSQRTSIYPGYLFLTGFDARHHIPFLGKSSFSNRAYSYISFGRERILQHVGGTENWLIPKYATTNPLLTSGEYVYSSLSTEVRGHEYGARKAGSVFGFSSEIRIPFFQYLLQQNWKNSLLKNFLLIGFFDAAVVWDGFLPEITKSSSATYHAENPVVKIDLQYNTNPWITGTGLGLRTSVLGYYVRLDYAWKIESKKIIDPKWIFSLGLDF